MRPFIYGVVFAAIVAASACNRDVPGATNYAPPASSPNGAAPAANTPASNAPAANDAGTPVATAGKEAAAGPARPSDWREVTLPAGTHLPVTLETAIGSDTSRVEDAVRARTSKAVIVNGESVLPAGSEVSGVVTDATQSGKVKGRAHVSVRFDTLIPQGPDVSNERYAIQTMQAGRTAPATKKKDALEIGGGAVGGALIGAIVGGKKGAGIGTAIGGGAGTAVVLDTRGKEVRLGPGAPMTLQLAQPVTIRVRAAR